MKGEALGLGGFVGIGKTVRTSPEHGLLADAPR